MNQFTICRVRLLACQTFTDESTSTWDFKSSKEHGATQL